MLAAQPSITAIATHRIAPCGATSWRGGDESNVITLALSDGPGITCKTKDKTPWQCVAGYAAQEDAASRLLCEGDALAPPPAWLAPLLTHDEYYELYAPAKPGAIVLRTGDGEDIWLAVRTKRGWRMSEEPVGQWIFWDDLRVLDASAITHDEAYAVVFTSYSGGSESGGAETSLLLLENDADRFVLRDRLLIGEFHWELDARDRAKCKGCADSYYARPHVEVRLEPTITTDHLTLTKKVTHLQLLADQCTKREIARGVQNEDDSICPIEEIRQVQKNIGAWGYRDGKWVRLGKRGTLAP